MSATGISILIVEDEAPIRSLLREILTPRFQCFAVATAGEAVALIESRPIHLALVDMGLPGLSGLSLCRFIVNRSPHTAVIVVSGNTDTQSVAEAMKAGASDYITKPFDLSEVVVTVERALKRNSPADVA